MPSNDDNSEPWALVGDAPQERSPIPHETQARTGFEEVNLNTFLVEDRIAAYGGLARGLDRKLKTYGGLRATIVVVAVMVLLVSAVVFIA